MTELTLEQLGLSEEKLLDTVAAAVASSVLHGSESDFVRRMEERVREQIDKSIDEVAAANVLPKITDHLEGLLLQSTNEWGEKKGKPVTFIEYLTARAEAYIAEPVDHNGKPKDRNASYNWRASTTRVAFLIDHHIQYHLDAAIKDALKDVNAKIGAAIVDTIKIQLKSTLNNLKVQVKT